MRYYNIQYYDPIYCYTVLTTILCNILYYTMTIQYYTIHNTIQYYTILYYTIRAIILYYTILYYTIIYYTIDYTILSYYYTIPL